MKLYYKIKRGFSSLVLFVKSKYQLLRYGYEFRDCWSLDYAAAKWLVPRLKHLKNTKHGVPIFVYDRVGFQDQYTPEQDKTAEEKWNNILDEMIFGFEFILKRDEYEDECYKFKPNFEEYTKLQQRAIEGRILFAKHFEDLWD